MSLIVIQLKMLLLIGIHIDHANLKDNGTWNVYYLIR